jgi:Holliday junction resolvasome RuvABC endonuclease subunit
MAGWSMYSVGCHTLVYEENAMIVLGIDPGIANVGFGCIDTDKRSVVVSGTLTTTPRRTPARRIYSIARRIEHLITAVGPDLIVIEEFRPFKFGRDRKHMSTIDKASGAIIYVSMKSPAQVHVIPPNIWMRKVMKLGRRDKFTKTTTMKFVEKRLCVRVRTEHEADALGMALYGGRYLNGEGT